MHNAEFIINKLHQDGHEAFIVGGTVRDKLLQRPIHDVDIATSALPERVMAIFPDNRVIGTGLQHGTVVVVVDNQNFEVTTFRADTNPDGRHSDVEFGVSQFIDASRRDFTINALAMDLQGNIVDHFDGKADIERKLIRTVGHPTDRFREDKLRMVRAVRFAAQLDFDLEPWTLAAIRSHASSVVEVSRERVRDELFKILLSANAVRGINLLRDTGLLKYVLPDFDKLVDREPVLAQASLTIMDSMAERAPLRLAALLCNNQVVAGSNLDAELDSLKLSREDQDFVLSLLLHQEEPMPSTLVDVRRLMSVAGDLMLDVIILRRAILRSTGRDETALDELKAMAVAISVQGDPLTLQDLDLTGTDIMERLGVAPGPKVGQFLRYALDEVLADPTKNSKSTLLTLIQADLQ